MKITYPPHLPLTHKRTQIRQAISDHQVVIISGQTGSGKTTQLPKICLEMGFGKTGLIGHTQPRRLAARTVAQRIACELGQTLGETVGVQMRFQQVLSPQTRIKLMTDGILLAEIQSDPSLRKYDVIIVDEAHERSLNIDFILGYLARLIPKRPDLKVIITSATIDSKRFSDHFFKACGQKVPVINVAGRTFPVEVRYRPLCPLDLGSKDLMDDAIDNDDEVENNTTAENNTDNTQLLHIRRDALSYQGYSKDGQAIDQVSAILGAVDELVEAGPGDILVFLAGERDIRDTATALAEHLGSRYIPPGSKDTSSKIPGAIEVLPLFSRLSNAEQSRIFSPHQHRRVVLATNVAETSLTVEGIKYVIDPGVARISRYSTKTKIQRLPIEEISQASANQRAGRCGRTSPGICIRLYSEEDYAKRPAFTEPEIQRTSLASVILQMTALKLGTVADFPFLDAPSPRSVRDGITLLQELGALKDPGTDDSPTNSDLELSSVGRSMSRLPLDPSLSRILLESKKLSVASEVLIIVAAMSMQDVRERPEEQRDTADELHRRFTDPNSDFVTYLRLWRYINERQKELSSSAFRRLCHREFLHYLRVRQWQDLVLQLKEIARSVGIKTRDITQFHGDINVEAIHRSLLVGMLSNLGSYQPLKREYLGARGSRFVIWPGSGLAGSTPDWVMAGELVETSRLFARTVGRIQVEWVEQAAKNLLKHTFFDPFWSTGSGTALVHERITLYGMILAADRRRTLASLGTQLIQGRVAQDYARELFISHALVAGEWMENYSFQQTNERRLEEAAQAQRRSRKVARFSVRDLEMYYESFLPAQVTSSRAFAAWWRRASKNQREKMVYPWSLLLPHGHDAQAFPDTWNTGEHTLALSYTFMVEPPTPISPLSAKARGEQKDHSKESFSEKSRGNKSGKQHAKRSKHKVREIDVIDLPEGVCVIIPLEVLACLQDRGFDWGVDGSLQERIGIFVRSLPKAVRKQLVPVPAFVSDVLPFFTKHLDLLPHNRPAFWDTLADATQEMRSVTLTEDHRLAVEQQLPTATRMHFTVVDRSGRVLGIDDDLSALQTTLRPHTQRAINNSAKHSGTKSEKDPKVHENSAKNKAPKVEDLAENSALSLWKAHPDPSDWHENLDVSLPTQISLHSQAGKVLAYPSLRVKNDQLSIELFAEAASQISEHHQALSWLLMNKLKLSHTRIITRHKGSQALTLAASPYYTNIEELTQSAQLAAAQSLLENYLGDRPVTSLVSPREIQGLISGAKNSFEDEVYKILLDVIDIVAALAELSKAQEALCAPSLKSLVEQIKKETNELVGCDFLNSTPPAWRHHLSRFLKAKTQRLNKAKNNLKQDQLLDDQIWEVEQAWALASKRVSQGILNAQALKNLETAKWLIEELRVSLFAQTLGTSTKVSVPRIMKFLNRI